MACETCFVSVGRRTSRVAVRGKETREEKEEEGNCGVCRCVLVRFVYIWSQCGRKRAVISESESRVPVSFWTTSRNSVDEVVMEMLRW